MAEGISSATLVGCTGLVGTQILKTLVSLPSQPTTIAIARREIPTTATNLKVVNEKDSSKWSDIIKTLSPVPSAFISALGTTRGQAGSFEAQRKIDYDLNLSLAQAARESGVRLYVLISSGGVSTSSLAPYPRMKAELEDAVKDLKFPHTIILKPGLLMGAREDSRPPEAVFRGIAKVLGAVSKGYLTYWWSQDADVVGRAAISAALQCAEGKKGEGVWLVGQSEIIRLGQTEWKGNI